MNRAVKKVGSSASRQINAVVVSSGLMEKTVKVRIGIQTWNRHIGKNFSKSRSLLVHDPACSLRTGDIVSISPGFRASKHVRHVVNSILAPFGEPIESRPPVPSEEERIAEVERKKIEKTARREENERRLEEVVSAVTGGVGGSSGGEGGKEGGGVGGGAGNGGRQEKLKKKKQKNNGGRQIAMLGSTASRSVNLDAA